MWFYVAMAVTCLFGLAFLVLELKEFVSLVLRGAGNVFSAGADVALFAGMSAHQLRPLIGSFIDLGHRIERLPFPTLAAVHGTCMAGGFELALFCDLIWAAEGTMLGLPETRLGIVPLAGGVERIAARAGLGRARTVALGGQLYPAEQFADWGVVDRVVAAGELHAAASARLASLRNHERACALRPVRLVRREGHEVGPGTWKIDWAFADALRRVDMQQPAGGVDQHHHAADPPAERSGCWHCRSRPHRHGGGAQGKGFPVPRRRL